MRDRWSSRRYLLRALTGGGSTGGLVTGEASVPRAGDRVTRARGQRVEVPIGAAQVHPPEHPGHHELAEGEDVADGQPVGDELAAHEVRRVAGQDDEPEVPGQEEDRRGDDERLLLLDQGTKLRRLLDRLPIEVRAVFGHGEVPLSGIASRRAYPAQPSLMRKVTSRRRRGACGCAARARTRPGARSSCRPRTCRSAGARW